MLSRLYEFAITTYGPEVGSSKQNYYANRLLVLSLNKKKIPAAYVYSTLCPKKLQKEMLAILCQTYK